MANLSLVCALRNHVTLILSNQSLSAFKDGGYREYSLFKQPYNAALQRFSYFYSAKFCVGVPLSTLV